MLGRQLVEPAHVQPHRARDEARLLVVDVLGHRIELRRPHDDDPRAHPVERVALERGQHLGIGHRDPRRFDGRQDRGLHLGRQHPIFMPRKSLSVLIGLREATAVPPADQV